MNAQTKMLHALSIYCMSLFPRTSAMPFCAPKISHDYHMPMILFPSGLLFGLPFENEATKDQNVPPWSPLAKKTFQVKP